MPRVPDIVGWIFEKEVAALEGSPKDIAICLAVSQIDFMVRVHAKWTIRYYFYGTLPTASDEKALKTTVAKLQEDALKIFNAKEPQKG